MGVWNPATPAGSDQISQGDDRIRELKAAIEEALPSNGCGFPGPAPLTAPEFWASFNRGLDAAKPAADTDYPGLLYSASDTGDLYRIADDGLTVEKIVKDPGNNAIHQRVAASLASVAGVITLDENRNSYNVTGAETVTSILGWSAGVVIVKWVSARIITHSANLYLKSALSRNVVANDVSIFEFVGANTVREIAFYGAGMGKETGESMMFNGGTCPAGFLEEDGTSYLRTDYPGLYSVIGTAHGAADGSHFNVPDSRGRFARGYDHGAGHDPDAASRTAANTGGATGDNVGSLQGESVGPHSHLFGRLGSTIANGVGAGKGLFVTSNDLSTENNTGTETRPKNVGKMFCIKF